MALPVAEPARLQTPPPGWPNAEARPAPPPAEAPRAAAVIGQIPSAPPAMLASASDEIIASVRQPPLAAPPPATDDAPARAPVAVAEGGHPAGLDITAVSAQSPLDPHILSIVEARKLLAAGEREQAEKLLSSALRDGSLAAVDELDRLFSEDSSRAPALLKVRRQAVELRPGDMRRLAALRDAARLDKNANYVRALDHVLRAFDPSEHPLAPPPLSAQQTQPGMLTLLTRHSRETAGEAFGIVWDGATSLFAKPATAYRMTGLERVAPGPMWTLSRLYEAALRLLDTPRFSLFHRRGPGPLTLTVALLQNPAAILGGEAQNDTPDVRWMLGHALASVLTQNALPLGLPEKDARVLWEVLLGAFGPPARAKMDREHANLSEMLWQTLAPRAQRRLKELLGNDDPTPFDLVVERANQSGRRVGMFLTGDFAHAARTVVTEHPALDPELLREPGGLAKLCGALPALADLLRLAVRPEYADARWHVPSPQSSRFPFAGSGGLPPV